jgi:transaldolase
MSARYGELGYLKKEAEERGIKLSEADVRWAEIAIFKKAYKIFKERDYPSKLLICSMRIGPPSDGERNACWHLEKLAGANIVYTCPPKFIELLMKIGDTIRFRHQIDEEVPEDVLHKLLRIPYFQMAYAEDGLTADEFGTHPPFLATAKAFGDGFQNIVNFVAKILRERRR